MKRRHLLALGLAAVIVASRPAELTARNQVTITLASLAPEGSVWDIELKQMGSDSSARSSRSCARACARRRRH